MHTPPFRLLRAGNSGNTTSRYTGNTTGNATGPDTGGSTHKDIGNSAGNYGILADVCCAPRLTPPPVPVRRRTRLGDLDTHFHCSLIGTCMSTTELRKLVPRHTGLDRQHASDLEIHHAAVQLAMDGGPGRKALQKALDERYTGTVRRFEQAKDAQALLELWKDGVKNGDIPGAYWAVMTHPCATAEVRQAAFGEVHMLSHLVGAANRADIRRLMMLEEENVALRDKVERQQEKLRELSMQRDAAIRELTGQIAELAERAARAERTVPADADLAAQVDTLRAALSMRDERLALHTSRRETAEQRAIDAAEKAAALRTALDNALALTATMQAESNAMEYAMLLSITQAATDRPGLERLHGKRMVYVGGRPGSNTVIKRLVETAGGKFMVHDGGIEIRKGMLATVLQRADMVLFPVDCIDHDSMHTLKRVCERHQVAYYPLRTASVACFLELMTRADMDGTREMAGPPLSRFCLRHG